MASVAVAAPAVALEEVKAFLRIGHSEEDAMIAGFVRSAEAACEAFTGRLLIVRTVKERVPASGAWTRLSAAPVQSIEAVAGLASGGAEQALAAEAYAIDIDAAGDGWVRVARSAEVKRAAVRFTAGMAEDWNGVPEPLRQGVVRLAAHLYLARDGAAAPPPASAAALWRPWRRLRVG
jgi:uncharacterized phiE125 gp8 family phage protein